MTKSNESKKVKEMNRRKMFVTVRPKIVGAKLVLAVIALAAICTCVTAQENTTALTPTLRIAEVVALGDDEFVEIVNGLNETKNLRNWGLVIDGTQIALQEHSLESGQRVRVHLSKGEKNETDLFLNSAVELNDIAGNVTLKDDTGENVASLEYKVQPDGSTTYTMTAEGFFEYPESNG